MGKHNNHDFLDTTMDAPTTDMKMKARHCCECWKYSEDISALKQKITSAIDIIQTGGDKSADLYKSAALFLIVQFGDIK